MAGYWRMVRLLRACMPSRTISRLITVASTGRRMKISVNAMSAALQGVAVVDDDAGAVIQFQLPTENHLLAGLQPLGHDHQPTAALTDTDKAALDLQRWLSVIRGCVIG